MKKFVVLVLVLCVGVQIGRMLEGAPKPAAAIGGQGGGAPICAAKNGDVNADKTVDLSDAVTILGNLFLGNPPELVPLCAMQGACGLPDTGQTKCYDASGAAILCTSAICSGQDGRYATGCDSADRFVDNADNTVTDTCTGLMWQKDTGNGGNLLNWCGALAYCEGLALAGHGDWRLPNIRELQSIIDYGRFSPSIDPAFSGLVTAYWSSTTSDGNVGSAWIVDFGGGDVHDLVKSRNIYVRAVRKAP